MLIGIPKEIKNHEYRVGLTPAGVLELINHGHTVLIQKNAGSGIGFTDVMYQEIGAKIIDTAREVYEQSNLIIKIKEPQMVEYELLKADQILFTYLHLAPDHQQIKGLLKSNCIAIAYETVTDQSGGLPLLAPMSEVAGRLSIQAGAFAMEKHNGGNGVLLGGVAGVKPANVVIIGGGIVGLNAARMAIGLNADVTILDYNLNVLKKIDNQYNGRIKTLYSNNFNLLDAIKQADLIIGAVLIPGALAPKIITESMLKDLKSGCVLVDVAIDQGGCFATSKPTTHDNPIYHVNGIIHYCVANMPGAVARTSTLALNNATLPFILQLANQGWKKALKNNVHLKNGLNICQGKVTHLAVAESFNCDYVNPDNCLV